MHMDHVINVAIMQNKIAFLPYPPPKPEVKTEDF